MSMGNESKDNTHILIVEDSRSISSELKRAIVDSYGIRCVVVSTYAEAKEYLNRSSKDIFLAILDIHLPDAAHGEIVDLFCSLSVPNIIFTSDVTEETRTRMLAKEVIDYVVKDSQAVQNILRYIERLLRNRGISVLVVEDSRSFRYSLCSMLHRQMFRVLDVPDGESAMDKINQDESIRLVLTDYAMPGMNGVELTRAIRMKYSKEEMPVIGISSSKTPMLTARFIKSGANDFIGKPFEPEEFYCRVDNNVEMVDTIRRLRKANKIKNQFLGMAAHDLRSPISGINGLTEMLLDGQYGDLSDEQREILEYMHAANLHMNDLVSDLLDLSVIESGRLRLARTEGSLAEVVNSRLRIHTLTAKGKSISITPPKNDLAPFSFDARRIGQVIDNLLTNAIKFSPPDSRSVLPWSRARKGRWSRSSIMARVFLPMKRTCFSRRSARPASSPPPERAAPGWDWLSSGRSWRPMAGGSGLKASSARARLSVLFFPCIDFHLFFFWRCLSEA